MDVLQKAIGNGPLGFLLTSENPDVSAWIVYNILSPPQVCCYNREKKFFCIEELDQMLGGICGLWEIHGKKASGKTYLCMKLAQNTSGKVLYFNISGMLCEEFTNNVVCFM